jgi:glycine oxidase
VAKSFDCIVIGDGIVGAASARALARSGSSVLLLGRSGLPGAATPASAGMLAPQIEVHAGDAALPLSIAGRDLYQSLAPELASLGHDIALTRGGIVHVALDAGEADALRREAEAQRGLGLDAEWWEPADVRRHVPHIGEEVTGALFAPRDASVDVKAVHTGLLADAERAGVELELEAGAESVRTHGSRVAGVKAASGEFTAPHVVVAAGAWSPKLLGLPRALPVEPVRGQIAQATWPAGEPKAILFGPEGYIVPRWGTAILGSTMEHVGFDTRTSAEGIGHIREFTGRILPALLTWPILRTWSGLRPLTPDGLPILGRDPEVEGLIYATGHGRRGIVLGPLTGEIVRDLIVDGASRWDLDPFAVTRFGTAS